MSIPMVRCAICNSQVTKRSTLDVPPYGRICRAHPEVGEFKETIAAQAAKVGQEKALWQKADNLMSTMMWVEGIRMQAFTAGVPLALGLLALSSRIPEYLRAVVIDEVIKLGPMTQEELDRVVVGAFHMQALQTKHGQELLKGVAHGS